MIAHRAAQEVPVSARGRRGHRWRGVAWLGLWLVGGCGHGLLAGAAAEGADTAPGTAAMAGAAPFELRTSLLEADRIIDTGGGADRPAPLHDPPFGDADSGHYMGFDERVLGLLNAGVAKAYPLRILVHHGIVHDAIGGKRMLVVHDPHSGLAAAFSGMLDGQVARYGHSGLVYDGSPLLYDGASRSLWSPLLGRGVAGRHSGRRMPRVAVVETTWWQWVEAYPQTRVLAAPQGSGIDYRVDPYAAYRVDATLAHPVRHRDDRYHPKEPVIGVEHEGRFKAYPFTELHDVGQRVHDTFAGLDLEIEFLSLIHI